ncbi:hypothetical protein ACIBAC_42560 [Streptomyces sp. NPDC051362]|uniref:hypothetical protein n=1 Tax=Streptomyces sp. NPDC051362 TaxID=3365651 RepID=UPI0037933ED2
MTVHSFWQGEPTVDLRFLLSSSSSRPSAASFAAHAQEHQEVGRLGAIESAMRMYRPARLSDLLPAGGRHEYLPRPIQVAAAAAREAIDQHPGCHIANVPSVEGDRHVKTSLG